MYKGHFYPLAKLMAIPSVFEYPQETVGGGSQSPLMDALISLMRA